MSRTLTNSPDAGLLAPDRPGRAMSEIELAEVIGAFNDVTAKLHGAHESLRREVGRLKDELRVANEQIERSRRLAALGEMAAGIAHEVRNPLGSIRLYARMLEQDLADRPGERRVAEKIGLAVRGLDAVVEDVLAFAREARVRPEPTDAWAVVDRAINECLATEDLEGGGPRRLRVERAADRGVGREQGELVCDPGLTHRALVNVILNAVQAMREDTSGPEPVLRVEVGSRCTADPDGGTGRFVILSVSDNGPGVPPEVIGRMFNPFFTTRATGTGLGLAIVHRIMDAHGGRVLVRNSGVAEGDQEGGDRPRSRGAVVELYFPDRVAREGESVTASEGTRAEGSPVPV